ncbi:capsule biosynthesis GfcC family protein [Vibrio sp. SCSIO 43135]|uniref:capsule biosynthesis GfcC family protein n=1 Tax=Vibrio sp. SCSIO 43135 TaxID=2819096 RepID=UPI00207562E6|nr:capsule biosynthesis GfcC family protein [Vibrio sp. SCSIO 43135]USD41322.1 capsule biosynthesis GfcC family protein [Vibrio sp. SCSIO 43135]
MKFSNLIQVISKQGRSMNLKYGIAFFSALCLSSPTLSAETNSKLSIQIPSESITLSYPEPVRLEQVFKDTIANSKQSSPLAYPLANQIFDISKEHEAEQLKTGVLKQLNQLVAEEDTFKESAKLLIEQIKRWDVGYREKISLDYDVIRLVPSSNPILAGQYEIIVPNRSNQVIVEGLLFRPGTLEIRSGYTVSDYLAEASLLSSAHRSYVWIIYPDGEFTRSGYAYWNDDQATVAPGSILFLGFNTDSEEMLELERKIVTLISMRKGL